MYTLKVKFDKNQSLLSYSKTFIKASNLVPGEAFLMLKGYPHSGARFMVVNSVIEEEVELEIIKMPSINIPHKDLKSLIAICREREGDKTYVSSLMAYGIECHVTKPEFRFSKQTIFCYACGGIIPKQTESLRVELASSSISKRFPWYTSASYNRVDRATASFHSNADQCEQGYMLAQKYLIWNRK